MIARHKKIYLFSIVWAALFSLLLFCFLVTKDYITYQTESAQSKATAVDSMGDRLSAVASDIGTSYGQISQDLVFLSAFSNNGDKLKETFQNFLDKNATYESFDIINKNNEQSYVNKYSEVAPISSLFNLRQNQVFLSNVRTENNNSVIYAAVPINLSQGGLTTSSSIIFSKINLDPLMLEVERDSRPGESLILVDSDGECMSCSGGGLKSYQTLPANLRVQILSNDQGYINENGNVYYFRKIYPAIAGNQIWNGLKAVRGKNYNPNQYYWVLISSTNENQLFMSAMKAKSSFLVSVLLSALMTFSILLALYFIQFSRRFLEKEHLR